MWWLDTGTYCEMITIRLLTYPSPPGVLTFCPRGGNTKDPSQQLSSLQYGTVNRGPHAVLQSSNTRFWTVQIGQDIQVPVKLSDLELILAVQGQLWVSSGWAWALEHSDRWGVVPAWTEEVLNAQRASQSGPDYGQGGPVRTQTYPPCPQYKVAFWALDLAQWKVTQDY